MDYIKERRFVLRQKFLFRCGVLILGILGSIVTDIYVCDAALQAIIFGITCSFISWGLVELWDFTVDTYVKYIDERQKFIDGIYKLLNNISDRLRKLHGNVNRNFVEEVYSLQDNIPLDNQEEINNVWRNLQSIFMELNRLLALEPVKNNVYCCSKEYHDMYNYFMRCFWLYSGATYNRHIYLQTLYQKMIGIEFEQDAESDIRDFFQELHNENDLNRRLREIELNMEDYKLPNGLLYEYNYGLIKADTHVTNHNFGESTIVKMYFIPMKELGIVIRSKISKVPLIKYLFVLSLLWPKKFNYCCLYKKDII